MIQGHDDGHIEMCKYPAAVLTDGGRNGHLSLSLPGFLFWVPAMISYTKVNLQNTSRYDY